MAEARHARWSAILMEAIEARASDIYLSAGQAVWLRVDGRLQRLAQAGETMDDDFMESLAEAFLSPGQLAGTTPSSSPLHTAAAASYTFAPCATGRPTNTSMSLPSDALTTFSSAAAAPASSVFW